MNIGDIFYCLFLRFVCRFAVFAMLTCYVTAIQTGHMGYDTWGGALMLILAAVFAVFDSCLPHVTFGAKREIKEE